MFVVFEIAGKQYDGLLGEEMRIDRIDAPEGPLTVDKVLLFKKSEDEVLIGKPYVEGARLNATVKGEEKGKKIKVFFYRQRKKSKKMKGHRQRYTRIRLESVVSEGREYKPSAKA